MYRAFLNVGYVLSENQLRLHFGQFGLVSDIYLPKHTSGRNKGFGFVTFDSAQALDRALLTPAHVISGVTVQVRALDNPIGGLVRQYTQIRRRFKRCYIL